MALDARRAEALGIGQVVSDTFGVLKRNFLTFFLLSLILSGLPAALVGYFQARSIESGAVGVWPNVFGWLTSLITGAILQAALVTATVADMNGRRMSVGECLSTGLRTFLPVIAISLLFGFGVAFGMLLLIVPGVMLLLAWFVTLPVYVVERRGIIGSFGRSADLTRGSRWRLLGLLALLLLATIVIGLVIGIPLGLAAVMVPDAVLWANVVTTPVSSALGAMVATTGVAVVYVELRRLKEGVDPASLASVFD